MRDISNIPKCELSKTKTKLRNTCEKYSKVKVSYRHRKIVWELSKDENIVTLKQYKGRGVVVMDKYKYIEKRISLLTTKQFKQVVTALVMIHQHMHKFGRYVIFNTTKNC